MDKLYNVGAYIRLSIEDSAYGSDSAENQREMLSKFIDIMPGWIEYKFYIDNGYTGANFQRPSFVEMMDDVRSGRVNLILVKDLSRFGRNYLEAGQYLEEELPSYGCRFVALSDGVDTENGENDIIPFLNAMNDYYLKNLSDRIRSVMAAKARDGQKIAGNAPYGFWRNPDDHTRLIIDEYAAGVVRRIFEMRAQGTGYPSIAKTLNADGILPPLIYQLEKTGRDSSHIKTRQWIVSTISMILRREDYIGTAVQLKNTVISYRNKKEVRRPKDERIRVENAFPVIIGSELWEAVQAINQAAAESCGNREKADKSIFSGLLICSDCGVSMTFRKFWKSYPSGKRISYTNAQCRTFQATGGTSCSVHSISGRVLHKLVASQIRQLAEQISLDEDAMRESLIQRFTSGISVSETESKKECTRLRQDLHKLEFAITELYEAWADGSVSEETFTDLIQKYESERQEKSRRLVLLEQSEKETAAKVSDIDHWIQSIRTHAAVKDIDRELLDSLVEKIEIGECISGSGNNAQEIRIYYKLVGLL